MTYTVNISAHPQSVWNALAYLEKTGGGGMSWVSQVKEWKEEFDIELHRPGYPKSDTMTFKSKEDATAWLLRFL